MKSLTMKFISVLVLLSILLAGCSAPAAPTTAPQAEEPTAVEAVSAPEPTVEEKEAEPAAAEPTAAKLTEEKAEQELVTITYHAVGSPQNDTDLIAQAMSDLLKEKGLNVDFNLILHDWGTWGDQMKLTYSSGEECDIVFTAPWANYNGYAADGVFLELDELLPEYAPELWASFEPGTWDAARINGKIYASINGGYIGNSAGPIVRKDLVEKAGIDPSAIKEWKDFEPLWKVIKDEGITPIGQLTGGDMAYLWGYDFITAGLPAAVRFDDETRTVINWYEQPEVKEMLTLVRQWYLDGYTFQDPKDINDIRADIKAGKVASLWLGSSTKPGVIPAEYVPMFGHEAVPFTMNKPEFSSTFNVTANLNAICKSTRHPEVAVQVLEKLNTDEEVFNLLAYGIEGKHWVWVDESLKLIGPGPDQANWSPGWGWEVGNQLLSYYTDKVTAESKVWELTKEKNASLPKSVLMGFNFNPEPVKTEVANISAIIGETNDMFLGMMDPEEALPEMLARMEEAGLDKVMEEMQNQINAWAASQ